MVKDMDFNEFNDYVDKKIEKQNAEMEARIIKTINKVLSEDKKDQPKQISKEEIEKIAAKAGTKAAEDHLLNLCGAAGLDTDSVKEGGISGLMGMIGGLMKGGSPPKKPTPEDKTQRSVHELNRFDPDRCQSCGERLARFNKCQTLHKDGKEIGVGATCRKCGAINFAYKHNQDEKPFYSLLSGKKIKGTPCPYCREIL